MTGKPLTKSELDSALLTIGYQPVSKLVYKASSSSIEVEHLLVFQKSVKSRNYLLGKAGYRDPIVVEACLSAYRKFIGIEDRRILRFNEASCITSSLFLNIDTKQQYTFAGALPADDVNVIISFTTEQVNPLLCDINTIERLYEVTLEGDGTPMRWALTNPAPRAAQAVLLAKKLGRPLSQVLNRLNKRFQLIGESLETHKEGATVDFLNYVWNYETTE